MKKRRTGARQSAEVADCLGIEWDRRTGASVHNVCIACFDQDFFPVEILTPVGKIKNFNQTYADIDEVFLENIFWRHSLSDFLV